MEHDETTSSGPEEYKLEGCCLTKVSIERFISYEELHHGKLIHFQSQTLGILASLEVTWRSKLLWKTYGRKTIIMRLPVDRIRTRHAAVIISILSIASTSRYHFGAQHISSPCLLAFEGKLCGLMIRQRNP